MALRDIAPLGITSPDITLPNIAMPDVALLDFAPPNIRFRDIALHDITLRDITLLGVTLPEIEITLPDIFLTTLYCLALLVEKNYVIFVPAELRSIREQPKQFHYFLPLHPFVCIPFCFIFSFCVRSVPFHLLLCFIAPTAYVCAQFHFAYFSVLFHLLHLHGRCFMPLFY